MESTNCVVLNTVLRRGGVPPPFSFVDILSFEEAYIQSFCHEVYAVVLLFSRTPQHEQVIKNQDDEHKELDATVYFIAPSENPCGMVGLIHAVANNEDKLSFNHDSALKDFLNKSANRSPEERAKLLLEHEALRTILYSLAAYENGRPNDGLHAHPVVLTAVNGHLYEFDGLTTKPIDHGMTSDGNLLETVGELCRRFMAWAQCDVGLSCVALVRVV